MCTDGRTRRFEQAFGRDANALKRFYEKYGSYHHRESLSIKQIQICYAKSRTTDPIAPD